ncbi:hypothetical protein ABGB17_10880 [Sphaerisporangium sp. B11E5]|uniref:hypothetical protein n=1 Tax=Sphaerisporangium sp. B11E5 TaxID=3153563 RepID=UPI00325CBC9B
MDETVVAARPRGLARVAPAVGLFFLAPLVGEYLLGNVPTSEILAIPFLAPMYGGGALLVREVARRAGRGWPTMLLLAAAYGVFQAGILDQSLFNSDYDGRYDFTSIAAVPWLGVSAYHAEAFVAGHVIWSIGIPIALVEALVPRRRTAPWLGWGGLAVTVVLFAFGCKIIFDDHTRTFMASAPQLAGAAVVTAGLVAAAFAVRKVPVSGRRTPRPVAVALIMCVLSGVFAARSESWGGAVLGAVLLAAMAVLLVRWSGREKWSPLHVVGAAGGALVTYMWLGYLLLYLTGVATPANLVGQTVLVVAVAGLVVLAARQSWRGRPESS